MTIETELSNLQAKLGPDRVRKAYQAYCLNHGIKRPRCIEDEVTILEAVAGPAPTPRAPVHSVVNGKPRIVFAAPGTKLPQTFTFRNQGLFGPVASGHGARCGLCGARATEAGTCRTCGGVSNKPSPARRVLNQIKSLGSYFH